MPVDFDIVHFLAASRFRRRTVSPWRGGWTFVLILALLSSQCLGLLHGIAHAGWSPSGKQVASAVFNAVLFDGTADSKPESAHAKHHHSCLEYDAAAGAVGIHVNFITPPLIPARRTILLLQAFVSWDKPVVCHFSSRAPPC